MIPRVNLVFLGFPGTLRRIVPDPSEINSNNNSSESLELGNLTISEEKAKSAGASRRVALLLDYPSQKFADYKKSSNGCCCLTGKPDICGCGNENERQTTKLTTLYEVVMRAGRKNLAADKAVAKCLSSVRRRQNIGALTLYSGSPDFALLPLNMSAEILRDGDCLLVVWSAMPDESRNVKSVAKQQKSIPNAYSSSHVDVFGIIAANGGVQNGGKTGWRHTESFPKDVNLEHVTTDSLLEIQANRGSNVSHIESTFQENISENIIQESHCSIDKTETRQLVEMENLESNPISTSEFSNRICSNISLENNDEKSDKSNAIDFENFTNNYQYEGRLTSNSILSKLSQNLSERSQKSQQINDSSPNSCEEKLLTEQFENSKSPTTFKNDTKSSKDENLESNVFTSHSVDSISEIQESSEDLIPEALKLLHTETSQERNRAKSSERTIEILRSMGAMMDSVSLRIDSALHQCNSV
ncbi:hypothetical protein HK100_000423 [Physocladia obscura]|uniref:Uncharacterized protein n=1 Tax=Physocladia obscura TaxID=109957 RepID=A0AAD5T0Y4_9FUNG|nr:hypothetical protein HK100_000423 [Physocladia obscura]